MGRRLPLLTAIVCSLAIVGVVGCGGDDESAGGGGGNTEAAKPTTVKVGTIPIADVAPLYLGIKQGFFTAEKLDVQPQLAEGGAAIVPAVLSGSDQIGFSNVTSLLIAASKDLPVTIISQGVLAGEDETKAFDALLVPKDSKITDLKQLEGKTVAVNNLNNVGPLTINTALKANGVDYKKIKYIEVPFPDMPAALDSGRVPAAWMVEPFVSQVKAAGGKTLATPFEQTAPNLTIATYFTSKKYAQENPDVIQRFARAMNKSLDYAQTHPDEVRQIVTTYTKIPPAAAEKMTLPTWKSDLNQPTIEKTAELAKTYGFVKEAPAIDELIYEPPS
jgi:NitT/TauT family transport system substrate-binding protein